MNLSDEYSGHSARSVSGRRVVMAMFAFGILATATLWVYWQWHLMPFMPLQRVLAEQFDDSRPHVTGGRRRLHEQTPFTLHVSMRVPFDPTLPTSAAEVEQRLVKTRDLAAKHLPESEYQILAVHLYFPKKEDRIEQDTFRKNIRTWEDVDENGEPLPDTSAADSED